MTRSVPGRPGRDTAKGTIPALFPRPARAFLLFSLLSLLGVSGCGWEGSSPRARIRDQGSASQESLPAEGFPLTFVDAAGDTTVFLRPPSRVVSLVPSATRSLQALGADDFLVGRTEFDTIGGVTRLPSVGGGQHPNLETLVVLEPDLVIRFTGDSDQTTPARLDDLGIPHIAFSLDRMADARHLIRVLGSLTGRESAADHLLAEMDATIRDVRERIQGLRPVRTAYVLGGNPPWVAGPGTFIHELLVTAGGENVFSDLDVLYGPVSLEAFLVRDIDVVLAPEGSEVPFTLAEMNLSRVSPRFELPGPDLAQSVRDMARILHPGAFR